MTDEIQIWAIDGTADSTKITKVELTNQAQTEKLLEGAPVKDPDMLIPGLTAGRQMPITGGYLERHLTTPILTSPTATWT